MYKSEDKSTWRVFREHHYLTQDFNKGANVFLLYWNNVLIGINSTLNLPSATLKYAFRTHRLVILPDYQNLGCGTKFEEFIGEYYKNQSCKLFLRTSHLRLGEHCTNSFLWKENATNKKIRKDENTVTEKQRKRFKNTDFKRCAYSFEYVGEEYNKKEHQNIICNGDCSFEEAEYFIKKIADKNKFITIITGVAKQSKETNTVWEEVAKKYKYRIEILHINKKINKTYTNSEFDVICTSKNAVNELKPYKENMNKIIAWNDNKQKFYINF